MDLFDAVAGTLAAEAVAFHHAGGAASLGDARHVDRLDVAEQIDAQFLADRIVGRAAQLADEPLRFAIGLGPWLRAVGREPFGAFAVEPSDVAALAAAGKTTRLVAEADLHGFIAVAVGGADLQDAAWTGLDHGDRDHFPGFVKYLRHPDLAAE